MKVVKKSIIMPFLGFVISGIGIWIIAYKINYHLLISSFHQLNYYWIFMMVFIYIIGFVFRGIRWHFMLLPIKKIRVSVAMGGVIVGYMANNIFPARAGEVIRALYIGNKESISRTSSFGTIFIERMFDGLVMVGILIVSSYFLTFSADDKGIVKYVILLSSLIFGIATSILLIGSKYGEICGKYMNKFLTILPLKLYRPLSLLFLKLLASMDFIRNAKGLLTVLLFSSLVWLVEGLVFFSGFYAFDLLANLPMAYFTLAFVNLGLLVPSAPGGVGIFQGASILALSFFGISPEVALSYSIVVHAVMIIPITVLGIIIINRYGLSIWKLRNS